MWEVTVWMTAGSVTWKMMLGKKPSTTMPTSIGSHATHSRTETSWRCGSFANSSDGVPKAVRW